MILAFFSPLAFCNDEGDGDGDGGGDGDGDVDGVAYCSVA